MSNKTVRVIYSRPSLGIQWPNNEFPSQTAETGAAFRALSEENTSWITGEHSLICVVDHTFADAAAFEANRSAIMALIPWWKNASNAAAVETYYSTYNIVVNITEVDGTVDHSAWTDITNI